MGDRVQVDLGGHQAATVIGPGARVGRRYVQDDDGDVWEVSAEKRRTGRVFANPDQLALRSRVSALAYRQGVVERTSWTPRQLADSTVLDVLRQPHLGNCPRSRNAIGQEVWAMSKRVAVDVAVQAHIGHVEIGAQVCGCIASGELPPAF